MASYKVEVVESSPISVLGEGPHWDVERQSLYYNDIYGDKQSISRYDFREDKTYNAVVPGHEVVSFIIPVDNTKDQFVIGSGKKIVLIEWDGRKGQAKPLKTLGEVESNLPENRFNDAKCDPFGRFYGGTMRIGKFFVARVNGENTQLPFIPSDRTELRHFREASGNVLSLYQQRAIRTAEERNWRLQRADVERENEQILLHRLLRSRCEGI